MAKADLRIDWATYEAARYACENWHYSGTVPVGKLAKVGAWERGEFVGVVLFGRGANSHLSSAYHLRQDEAVELVRVALKKHSAPVSKIKAIAIRFLKKANPGLRLIVSYADPKQNHHGGIYQAGNWIYAGKSQAQSELLINGRLTHKRTAHNRYGTASAEKISEKFGLAVEWAPIEWKHIYLMPLDEAMRAQIAPLAKPYPKRAKQAMAEHPSAQRQGSTDPHAPAFTGFENARSQTTS